MFICFCSLPYKSICCSNFCHYDQENINTKTYPKYHSVFTPHRSYRDSSSSSSTPPFRLGSKIIYDETWSSNKQYNTRVAAFIDHIDEKFNIKTDEISNKHKSSRTCSYQISTGQIIHERIYSGRDETKLCLQIAVNGASKSMRGELPSSNLNLNNGDFGDDAGVFVENRDFCFIGKFKMN